MKNLTTHDFKSDDMLLTACIWYANIDLTGLADYALKALIGAIIWFGFKMATEHFSAKLKEKKAKENEKKESETESKDEDQ
jgi:phosphotransferase system  glucose/maltose/N-acetylglucosamine-specific IIC component